MKNSKSKLSKFDKRLKTLAAKTNEQKEKFIEQLKKYPIIQIACERSGIGRSTYYLWKNTDKEFAKRADRALGEGVDFVNDMAESMLVKNIQNGNNTAIIFWLKNHHKDYNDKIYHMHEVTEVQTFTKEEELALRETIQRIGLESILKRKGKYEKINSEKIAKGENEKIDSRDGKERALNIAEFMKGYNAEKDKK